MLKIGTLRASGFIDNRTVETLYLEGIHELRPIVRGSTSLGLQILGVRYFLTDLSL